MLYFFEFLNYFIVVVNNGCLIVEIGSYLFNCLVKV